MNTAIGKASPHKNRGLVTGRPDHLPPSAPARTRLVLVMLLCPWILSASCSAKTKPGPKQVYEKWSVAVTRKDCKALYRLLDEKSRWAVMSAARDTAKAASMIQRTYPVERRRDALSKLGVRIADGDPAVYFADICRRYHYPALLADTAGTIAELEVKGHKAWVVTKRGTKVELSRDRYGRWGCTALRNQLARRQMLAANFVKIVEQNAKVFGRSIRPEAKPEKD